MSCSMAGIAVNEAHQNVYRAAHENTPAALMRPLPQKCKPPDAIEPDCREGVREKLERMKELCKERNNLYEKQNDLKGQKWKVEKSLER